MLTLKLNKPLDTKIRILCLGAHSDDIEIGCGGTILRLVQEYSIPSIHWNVFSAHGERAEEAHRSATSFMDGVTDNTIAIMDYRDGFFPYTGNRIKENFEELKQRLSPDIIFTHYRNDLHQDHRLICELTWNTFRNHLILEYEIPKYDGDIGTPNFYIQIDRAIAYKKTRLIMDHFVSQRGKVWFSEDTLKSIMHLRGMESRAPEKFAEAFYCRKVIL